MTSRPLVAANSWPPNTGTLLATYSSPPIAGHVRLAAACWPCASGSPAYRPHTTGRLPLTVNLPVFFWPCTPGRPSLAAHCLPPGHVRLVLAADFCLCTTGSALLITSCLPPATGGLSGALPWAQSGATISTNEEK